MKTDEGPVLETLSSLECRTMDNVQNSLIPNIIHSGQSKAFMCIKIQNRPYRTLACELTTFRDTSTSISEGRSDQPFNSVPSSWSPDRSHNWMQHKQGDNNQFA
jgi:hypothetical protein